MHLIWLNIFQTFKCTLPNRLAKRENVNLYISNYHKVDSSFATLGLCMKKLAGSMLPLHTRLGATSVIRPEPKAGFSRSTSRSPTYRELVGRQFLIDDLADDPGIFPIVPGQTWRTQGGVGLLSAALGVDVRTLGRLGEGGETGFYLFLGVRCPG